MVSAEQVTAIREKAEALGGRSLGAQGDLLVEMAAQRACVYCQRRDIPEEMEQAVAALVLSIADREGNVKSVKRGDTSVTYGEMPEKGALAELAPFRRLGTLKKGGATT